MTLIELFFLSISLIGFYTYFKIKVSLKNTNNSFMEKEAARILFKDCEANKRCLSCIFNIYFFIFFIKFLYTHN